MRIQRQTSTVHLPHKTDSFALQINIFRPFVCVYQSAFEVLYAFDLDLWCQLQFVNTAGSIKGPIAGPTYLSDDLKDHKR